MANTRQPAPRRDSPFTAAAAPTLTSMPSSAGMLGITPAVWITLRTSVFPGAADASIVAAAAYCKARDLDVLKKPCHIVPMKVKDAATGEEAWRDVIMPGIYELRTTAMRTEMYVGQDDPEYGDEIEVPIDINATGGATIKVPQWCRVTVWRFSRATGAPVKFTHSERFTEAVVRTGSGVINRMWKQRPVGQLTKCAEAGALRKAFPEELGGVHTEDEMAGRDESHDIPASAGAMDVPASASSLTDELRAASRSRPIPTVDVTRDADRVPAPADDNPDAGHLLALAADASNPDELDWVRSKLAEFLDAGSLTEAEARVVETAIVAAVARLSGEEGGE